MITPDATNPVITERGFDNVYRVCITDRVQGPAAADYAVSKLGLHRLAVIHDKSAYGQGIAGEFRKRAEQLKAEVLCFEGISEGDRDFSPVLTKVRSLRADGIYFGGMYPEGALLMKQARSLGISSRFLVGDGCFDPELINIGGASAEGTLITFLAPPWEQHDSAKAFVKKYESEYGPVKAYAPLSYDAANILIDAIERARTRDRRNVNAVLKSPGYVYNGIVGPTSFDSHGDVRGRKPFIYTVTGGRFVLAGTGK